MRTPGSTWLKRAVLAVTLGGAAFTLAAQPAMADPDWNHRRWHHRHYYRDYRPVYPPPVYYSPPPRVYYAPPPPVYYQPPGVGLSVTIPIR